METKLEQVAEELRSLLVEAEFASRWTLIEAYHTTGKMINELYDSQIGESKETKQSIVQQLASKVGKSERMLWYASKFFETYPDLNALPDGKNINFKQIIKKYLTSSTDEEMSDTSPSAAPKQLETNKPNLRVHNDCGKYIFEFKPDQMCHCSSIEGEEGHIAIIDQSQLD